MIEETGWTYEEVGDLTLPQARELLTYWNERNGGGKGGGGGTGGAPVIRDMTPEQMQVIAAQYGRPLGR